MHILSFNTTSFCGEKSLLTNVVVRYNVVGFDNQLDTLSFVLVTDLCHLMVDV